MKPNKRNDELEQHIVTMTASMAETPHPPAASRSAEDFFTSLPTGMYWTSSFLIGRAGEPLHPLDRWRCTHLQQVQRLDDEVPIIHG